MKDFRETFKDRIDMTNGTAVIDEEIYKKIQLDVMWHILKAVNVGGEFTRSTADVTRIIRQEMDAV